MELITANFDPVDVGKILSTPLPPHTAPDKITWHLEKKGSYMVKLAYSLALELITETTDPDPGWSKLWALKIPPKNMACVRRVCNGYMPTRGELYRRHIV